MSGRESIASQILRLQQDVNSYGASPLLAEVDYRFIERLERLAASDGYAAAVCIELRANLPDGMQDLSRIRQIHNHCAEARIYYELIERGTAITRVHGNATRPDFEIAVNGGPVFAEIKAISMQGGDGKYAGVFEEGFANKLGIEEQIQRGKTVAIAEQTIAPVGRRGEPNDARSLRLVIECLIDKVRNLVKAGQLPAGASILICDINQFNLGCTAEESLQPVFIDPLTGTKGSGTLYHVAKGQMGQPIHRPAEFEGQPVSSDGVLSQSGVLVKFPNIAAVVFRYGWSPTRYLGVMQTGVSSQVRSVVTSICELSTDGNS